MALKLKTKPKVIRTLGQKRRVVELVKSGAKPIKALKEVFGDTATISMKDKLLALIHVSHYRQTLLSKCDYCGLGPDHPACRQDICRGCGAERRIS